MDNAIQDIDPFGGLRKRIATLEKRIENLKQGISEQREQLRDAYRRLEVAQDRREFDSLKAFIRVKSADHGWGATSLLSFAKWAIAQGFTPDQLIDAAQQKSKMAAPPKPPPKKSIEIEL
ncbi:MAG: hypothetical protein O9320_13090 [Magnetospirillum sp.]|nr:hypothetical protein [Magnetospirillum sp.]